MCLPVYKNSILETQFKGVVCQHVLLSAITTDVHFFGGGEYSYGFIMERSGKAIVHPLLPKPTMESYTYLDITNLEPEADVVSDVINPMKQYVIWLLQ